MIDKEGNAKIMDFGIARSISAKVRGEERFKKLMERVKYEWEHFEE